MRKRKLAKGEVMVGATKKIGKYIVVRGMNAFGIVLEKGEQRLYKSGHLSSAQAKKIYDSVRTLRDVENYLGRH